MQGKFQRIYVLVIVQILGISAWALEPDMRNIETGLLIPNENYCDQPYVVITRDGGWLCVMTTGPGREGNRGQHIISTVSKDKGRTWSRPVDIEPSGGPEASWAIPLITPQGRVYVFYTYNGENIRTLPDGKNIRADTQGWFVYKYSDDNGKNWSRRYRLPMRVTACDRSNNWKGKVQMFWSIDSPITFGHSAMFGFTKLGKYLLKEGEGWFYRSDNILTEPDAGKIQWQLLPDGDYGLRNPRFGSVQEEHNIVALSNHDLFCMYRTTLGFPAQSYSRDGGHTWSMPEAATYRPGGRRFKHNRACPKIWRTKNGRYLFWFNNHAMKSYQTRNPVWLCGGIEKNGYIYWSQPEILLYDPVDKSKGMSYPDLIEQDGRYWVTETQKTVARVHEIDRSLLEGLWQQGKVRRVASRGLMFDYKSDRQGSLQLRMPGLPDIAAGGGFTIDFRFFCRELSPGQVILDARTAEGKGLSLTLSDKQSIALTIYTATGERSWDCDPGSITAGKWHHAAVIVDGASRVISWVIDGILCDGGKLRRQGWYRLNKTIKIPACPQGIPVRIAPSLKGVVKALRIYNRYLRTSEVIGNYYAGLCLDGRKISKAATGLQKGENRSAADTPVALKASDNRNLPLPQQQAVYVSGKDGYDVYRIPALLSTGKGTLLAFCEGRRTGLSDSGNIDLLVKRSTDLGKTWSKQIVIRDDGGNTCGNPAPVLDKQAGVIWLVSTWNLGTDHEPQIIYQKSKDTRRIFLSCSQDDGKTWTTAREITSQVKKPDWTWYATGPGSGIQLQRGRFAGRLIIPCDHIEAGSKKYFSHIIYSDDHGQTWHLGGSTPTDQVNECQVVELADGRLMLNMRNYDRRYRQRALSISKDGGMTWSPLWHHPALIEPICQASFIRYTLAGIEGKNRLLFSNPASENKRVNMTIRLSYDEGGSWQTSKSLYAGPSAYSDMAVLADKSFGCLYECGIHHPYEKIVFAKCTLEWLTDGRDHSGYPAN